mgnify:CR=1 FL=1
MIIVLKPEASESEVDHIIDRLRDLGLKWGWRWPSES